MQIGGIQHFSSIDFPGHLAAVVFTMGCDFRCPFCHNSERMVLQISSVPTKKNDCQWDYLSKVMEFEFSQK